MAENAYIEEANYQWNVNIINCKSIETWESNSNVKEGGSEKWND